MSYVSKSSIIAVGKSVRKSLLLAIDAGLVDHETRITDFVTGGRAQSTTVAITGANYTILSTDEIVLLTNAGVDRTMTLPDANTIEGKVYTIKKIDSGNNMLIASVSSQTLDGVNITASPHSIGTQWDYISFVARGGAWYIVG